MRETESLNYGMTFDPYPYLTLYLKQKDRTNLNHKWLRCILKPYSGIPGSIDDVARLFVNADYDKGKKRDQKRQDYDKGKKRDQKCIYFSNSKSSVMKKFGPEYLRKPMVTDVAKLYRHREEKHGFSGMLGSLGCMVWEWFGCPYTFKGQYVRRDHAPEVPFVANNVTYPWGYYLVDGIYSEFVTLLKMIPEPDDDDNNRILYKRKQESARKDVK
ncbi:RNA-directed DNA polymerase, eukaryota [Tanacetum coccineum]